jgi:methanethiol S-methyltransferase
MLVVRRPSLAARLFAWGGGLAFVLSLLFFLHTYLVRFGYPPRADVGGMAVVANVFLFSVFALHHSLFARAGLKARIQRVVGPVLERSVYTWTASMLFLLVCWWWQPLPGTLYQLSGFAAGAGYALQATGLIMTAVGSARLDVLDLAGIRPVLRAASGAQAIRPVLETGGLYGIVRHPVYLAWALFVFGTPHMTMTRFVFAVTSTAYLMIAIPFEERSLIQTFGADYRAYRQRVRWRMIPGIY